MRRIGIDTGGTFTDLLVLENGRMRALKVPSTPADPSRAVADGLRRLGAGPADIVHGSTVGTNALLERRGARTALVTTRGFADVLEIGRQARPALYELEPQPEAPLIPADLRLEIGERTLAGGEVEAAPDPEELEAIRATLVKAGVESLAIVLLHSYRNPENEDRVADALSGAGFEVSCSHQVLRQYREYERTVATVVNAYIRPVMANYLKRLPVPAGGRLRVMRSNGGSISVDAAAAAPVETILSGPAGGVVGAAYLGRLTGEERIITFDMGGTSTDVSLLDGGPSLAAELRVSGLPLRVPMLDIQTVGAGGGSVAWVDPGGALRVGPRSAGADPGPACYGRGDEVTVTDAHVVLGRILPERFLGGEMKLDTERARRLMDRFAAELGIEPAQAAEGILEVAQATMERAIRVISLERGHEPSRFVLYCFGGAGGLHVARMARSLGMPQARIPSQPGLFSALGMLTSDVVFDRSETLLQPLEEDSLQQTEAVYLRMEERASAELAAEGFGPQETAHSRTADLRYRGQSFELSVAFGPRMADAFHRLHEMRYGHSRVDRPIEIVNARVRSIGRAIPPSLAKEQLGAEDPGHACVGSRAVHLEGGDQTDVPVFDREKMSAGMLVPGPALIVEYSSTVWVPEGARLSMDPWRSLLMETGA